MKRTCAGLLALLLLVFCGCASEGDVTVEPSDTAAPIESTPELSSEPTTDVSDEDTRGIIGSHATDIRMGLTKFGLDEAPFSAAPDEAKEVFAHSCNATYKDETLGVTYDYSLTLDSKFQIIGASFGISNQDAKVDVYTDIATQYLGFCATMPYDKSSTEEAKSFIEDNLADISANNSAEIVIGDAKFELHGLKAGNYFGEYWLDISKVA